MATASSDGSLVEAKGVIPWVVMARYSYQPGR